MIRVNIFLGENVGVKSLNIKINKEDTIDELIRKSLSGFNQIFLNIETNYRISPIFTEYHLKPSKKSGKPNLDLPSKDIKVNLGFNRYVTISSCGETQYSLVWKEGESCDFVVLSKPKPKSKCATCLIL